MRTVSIGSTILVFLSILVLACIAYLPGLEGPFVFDDEPNITKNTGIQVSELSYENLKNAAFSFPSGPLSRPVSYISFALNYYFYGLEPYSFKVVNLGIHLAVGALITWCAYLLFAIVGFSNSSSSSHKRYLLVAVFISAIFLLHPFNLSSVLYVVQRMTSLAALFMYLSLACYLLGRKKMLLPQAGSQTLSIAWCWMLSILVFFPLAVLSKENALLLPFLVLVIESTLFNWYSVLPLHQRIMQGLRYLLWFGVLLLIVVVIYAWEGIAAGYIHRDFSLAERLLTEPRILFRYLSLVVIPNNRGMTFYHDDIPVYSSFTEGGALFYILGWGLILASALVLRKRAKWFAFAVFWFLVAHSMESSFVALELAHEHRNYVPMFGILVAIGALLLATEKIWESGKFYAGLALLVLLVLAASTFVRATDWRDLEALVDRQQRLNPTSPRANYAVGQYLFAKLLIQNNVAAQEQLYQQILPYFLAVNENDPTDFSGLLSLLRLDDQMGYTLNKDWLAQVLEMSRTVPLGLTDVSHVQDVMHCQLNKYCNLDIDALKAIVEGVLSNNTLPQGFELSLKADLGIYLSLQNRKSESVKYLLDVVRLNPQLWIYRLEAINNLIALERFEEARALIEEALSMEAPQEYRSVFSSQKEKISQLEKDRG